MIGDRQRRRAPRRFYSEQVDQSVDAMFPWALDEEVLHGHRRRHDLGSNSRIAWHQRAVRQGWPVAPDRRVKPFRPRWIDGVIDGIDPFHVRTKPGLPGEVEGEVDAETAGFGHRVNQARKRRPRVTTEIISLGEIGRRYQ